MREKAKHILFIALIIFISFVLGMIFSPSGKIVRKLHKKLSYTKSSAQKLYNAWDKEKLFFKNGTSLHIFEEENESYAIYFWAAWCPHCRNVTKEINSIKNSDFPLIGLSFDVSKDEYYSYLEESSCFWNDLFQQQDEEFVFCKRVDSYNIPSIPSLWIVDKGKIQKIYIGEKGIREFVNFKN